MTYTAIFTALLILLLSSAASAQTERDFAGQSLDQVIVTPETVRSAIVPAQRLPKLQLRSDSERFELSLRHRNGTTLILGPLGISLSARF